MTSTPTTTTFGTPFVLRIRMRRAWPPTSPRRPTIISSVCLAQVLFPSRYSVIFDTVWPMSLRHNNGAGLANRLLQLQPADIGWPTGNGKKLSCSQVQLGQATGLAFALFLSISCGPSYVRRLYTRQFKLVSKRLSESRLLVSAGCLCEFNATSKR